MIYIKKLQFIVILTVLSCNLLFAQDQLFKKDNTKVEAKILEITPTSIKYKLFNYQDGPLIIVDKNEVAMIIYQNGTHEIIKSNEVAPNTTTIVYQDNSLLKARINDSLRLSKWNERTMYKNIVSVNFLSLYNMCAEISYMREIKKANMNIYVPLSFSFSTPTFSQPNLGLFTTYKYYYNNLKITKKAIETGIGIHLHTSGKRAVTHFIGPYFGFAQLNGTFDEGYYGNNYSSSQIITHAFVLNRYYAMLDNGILFRVNKHFNIMTMFSFGLYNDEFIKNNPARFNNNSYNYLPSGISSVYAFKLNFSMGYRF